MLNFDLYAIYTEDNERNGSIKEFFTSFNEAKANRFKYANWFCPKGDVWINRYDAGFHESYSCRINENGDIVSEFNWNKYKKI